MEQTDKEGQQPEHINGVWGIDIGNHSLKALRCKLDEKSNIVADAVVYIPYKTENDKTENDNAKKIVHDALSKFKEECKGKDIEGYKIAINIPLGENGVMRFIRMPKVDSRYIDDFIKYALIKHLQLKNDNSDPKDFNCQKHCFHDRNNNALEESYGLFAVKKVIVNEYVDQSKDLFNLSENNKQPESAEQPQNIIQLTPVALYNMAIHEYFKDNFSSAEYNVYYPQPFIGLLSINSKNTDLVLTNGNDAYARDISTGWEKINDNSDNKTSNKDNSDKNTIVDFVNEIYNAIRDFIAVKHYATIDKMLVLGNVDWMNDNAENEKKENEKKKELKQKLKEKLDGITIRKAEFSGINLDQLDKIEDYSNHPLEYSVCYGLCLQGLGIAEIDDINFLKKTDDSTD